MGSRRATRRPRAWSPRSRRGARPDARRDDGLVLTRLAFDILGTIPVDVVETTVRVVRPGRTIELVEATLTHNGRAAVVLRAWLMQPPTPPTCTPPRCHGSIHPPTCRHGTATVWPGGFVASADVRREQVEPGRAAFWARTPLPLVEGEPVSPARRRGRPVRHRQRHDRARRSAGRRLPNVDLTAHLFAAPRGEWIGFDTTVCFGPAGVGVTNSVVHDIHRPIGTMSQILTLRPIS